MTFLTISSDTLLLHNIYSVFVLQKIDFGKNEKPNQNQKRDEREFEDKFYF